MRNKSHDASRDIERDEVSRICNNTKISKSYSTPFTQLSIHATAMLKQCKYSKILLFISQSKLNQFKASNSKTKHILVHLNFIASYLEV